MDEEAQIVSTVDDACTVISAWFGWDNDLAGPKITVPFVIPQAIETVNRRLGRLWLDNAARTGANIFNSQDFLISPHQYEAQADGIVPIIRENQGVWACGFRPDMGAQMWVTGDWPSEHRDTGGWRPTQDVVDTAIIFVLLANSMWASADCRMDEDDEKPREADRLLWKFAPWDGFAGFWTNMDQTLVRMQGWGWGVTARR